MPDEDVRVDECAQPPRRGSTCPRGADDVIPCDVALGGGDGDGAGQREELRGSCQHSPVAFDAEHHIVALADPERLTHGLRDSDLSLGTHPRCDLPQPSPYRSCRCKDTNKSNGGAVLESVPAPDRRVGDVRDPGRSALQGCSGATDGPDVMGRSAVRIMPVLRYPGGRSVRTF